MVTSAGWPFAHVGDVGLVHLHFGGDHAHVRNGHEETALGILNAGHDVFAHAHGDVADDAVDGRGVGGLAQHVLRVRQHGSGLVHSRARLLARGARLLHLRLAGVQAPPRRRRRWPCPRRNPAWR